ncbi:helix-turn-helix domain-containing protein [Desulfofustis limnaeus]|uniref:DNA binding HTH domain-containing protein n=1 Tax=Desulfofustis limnaeus TaxID=2740163 RepID=A0ABM7W6T0_9BACT|nr:helix-turn-helix domain-containing protein [Desulfofustis limnaeus]BDD86674.1 hypothetical protein DPPLL_10390 [Desulfofustis limnaeus]
MKHRILIIDDEASIRESLSGILEDEGFRAVAAAEALLPYRSNDFKEARRPFERGCLHAKLNENDGNISSTAEQIGLERSHLYKKLKSLDLIS